MWCKILNECKLGFTREKSLSGGAERDHSLQNYANFAVLADLHPQGRGAAAGMVNALTEAFQ